MKRKLGLVATAGTFVVALALVLTACGGSDGSKGVASLTDTTGESSGGRQGSNDDRGRGTSEKEREKAQLEYAQCMREHGVDLPDPVNGRFEFRANRGEEKKVAEAQKACGHILRDAAPPVSEEQEAQIREAALEFAKCMRKHGVDMPDPRFEARGGVLMQMPQGAEDDPKFEEAQRACQSILNDAQPDGSSAQGSDS
jgi:hypothetical protein